MYVQVAGLHRPTEVLPVITCLMFVQMTGLNMVYRSFANLVINTCLAFCACGRIWTGSTLSLLVNMFAFWIDSAEYLPIDDFQK